MSAAVNDRPHEIVPAVHLPLTGELHPLRREFARWLATGNLITITLAVVVCTTIYFWPRPAPPGYIDLPEVDARIISPPPIVEHSGGGKASDDFVFTPDTKVDYEPTDSPVVLDEPRLEDQGGGNGKEGPLDTGPITTLEGTGPLIDIPAPAPRSEDGFIWFDKEPELMSIDRPVYPEMVRDAGIDGTVMVRVFVGLNGHVKDARVVEGSPMLHEPALASARTAFFKPAMQGTHPVEVWVVIPITFSLRERY